MFAFQRTAVVLLKDGRRALVISVHKLAVDAVEHLILSANGVDDLTEANLLCSSVDGKVGLGKGNGRKQDGDE